MIRSLPPSAFESRVLVERIESDALRGNALGDPHVRSLSVYLPPGYEREDRRYPAVYLLAGYMAVGAYEMNFNMWQETIQARMDRLITQGKIPPMILVLPDLATRYGGSQYINSPGTGRYADHLLELVEFVDERFRTLADREHRALLGKSSGGYGAFITAMRRPEVFSMTADMSGDKFFEMCYRPTFPKFAQACARVPSFEEVLKAPGSALLRYGFDTAFNIMNIAAMSACYSPNPDAPLGFDLPVDMRTCELNEAVWERWLQHDPVRLVDEHADALRSLRLLYFDCGYRDEFYMHFGSRILSKRLRERDIEHRYDEFDGVHKNSQLYRYDVALEAIGKALPR